MACVIGIAIAWVSLFEVNMSLFSGLLQTHYITWIFLPAGLRLVTILLFGEIAVLGLFIGALLSGAILKIGLFASIALSLISAINPYISVNITRHLLRVDALLNNLSALQLLTLSFTSALFSGVGHNIYFYAVNISKQPFTDTLAMFIGDFVGCLILLYLFGLAIKLIRKSVAN